LKSRLTPRETTSFGDAPPDWPRRLRLPVLRESQLTDIVVEALSGRLPDCRIEPTGTLEATITTRRKGVLTAQLGPLWSTLVGCEPEERLGELEPFLKSLVDAARALDVRGRRRRRDRVVPLIKDDSFFDQMEPGFQPASEHLVADLSIVYAFDRPRSLDIMTEAERVAMGVPAGELRALAVRNLRRLVPEIRHHESGSGYVLLAGGNFEASLLDDLWTKLAADVSGDLIACAPARDMILYTGSATPGAIEDLRELASRVINEGGYSLSATLLRWTGLGWEPYRPSERPH
jgi:uncharacterized protein DUF1444